MFEFSSITARHVSASFILGFALILTMVPAIAQINPAPADRQRREPIDPHRGRCASPRTLPVEALGHAGEAAADLERQLDDGVAREARRDRFEVCDFPGRAAADYSVSSSLGQVQRSATSMWDETVLPASTCNSGPGAFSGYTRLPLSVAGRLQTGPLGTVQLAAASNSCPRVPSLSGSAAASKCRRGSRAVSPLANRAAAWG